LVNDFDEHQFWALLTDVFRLSQKPFTASGSLVPLLIVLVATVWGFFIHAKAPCPGLSSSRRDQRPGVTNG
jgi:hypothetical protein